MSATTGAVVAVADRPPRSALVLVALVTGAIVANINLAVANVALPTIGDDLGASQDQLTLVANSFALGLASTVLYLGAIGDRYGRKLLFVIGAVATVPTSMLAAWAPTVEVLIAARFLGGVAAALVFPTTLSIIGALYRGRPRITAIALWSGLGGGFAAVGPVIGGWMLEYFWWGSVFLISLPLVVVALVIGLIVLPWHSQEERFPVDHVGGVLSVMGVGGLVLWIEHLDDGWTLSRWVNLGIVAAVLGVFFWRQTRARRPLVSLPLAKARTFWVAFVAGAITFGSLIGAMFVGQQFMQNVLGYDPFISAAVVLPSAICTAVFGQVAGRLIAARGSQFTFMLGLGSVAFAFTLMLITWRTGASIWWVLIAFAFVGTGVGLSATPASRSLMNSVPANRGGMGSAFLDLTRDLGGAIIQAFMGAVLAGAYAARVSKELASLPADQASKVSDTVADQLTSSFESASSVAGQYTGTTAQEILAGASAAFTEGKSAAMAIALVFTLIGLALVFLRYPGHKEEEAYFEKVQSGGVTEQGAPST